MKALLLLAEGFEETEAIQTFDVLSRTKKIDVTLASINDNIQVKSSHGLLVTSHALLKDLELSGFEFLILPGGKLGVQNLEASPLVRDTILYFYNHKKNIHAICAAPPILYRLKAIDKDNPYICFPGFEQLENGPQYQYDAEVVDTKNNVTGRSMGYTLKFALQIVRHHLGEEDVKQIEKGIFGLR